LIAVLDAKINAQNNLVAVSRKKVLDCASQIKSLQNENTFMQQQLGDFKQLLERDLLALNPKILNEMRIKF